MCNDATNGYIELLKTRKMLTELKAVKVNFTIKTNVIRFGTNNEMGYFRSVTVHWYELKNGTKNYVMHNKKGAYSSR